RANRACSSQPLCQQLSTLSADPASMRRRCCCKCRHHVGYYTQDLGCLDRLPFHPSTNSQQCQAKQHWASDPQKRLEEGASSRYNNLVVAEGDCRSKCIQKT